VNRSENDKRKRNSDGKTRDKKKKNRIDNNRSRLKKTEEVKDITNKIYNN
jgi:hypothetical protein